jgi:Fic family protein
LPRRLTAITAVGQKTTIVRDGVEWLLLPRGARFKVPTQPIEHFGVALKHEGVDLRVLSQLFAQPTAPELTSFVASNPAGKYTRRAWFLYEWMTQHTLDVPEPYAVQYIPLLDPNQYLVRRGSRSNRHKVSNNLPGVPGFCPLIRRTERLAPDRIAELAAEARRMISDADPAVLRRAVGFMLLNESKGSFGIEGETPPQNRLERWGRLIAEAKDISLSIDTLEDLHRSLFEQPSYVRPGLRTEGGFVGRHDGRDQTPIPDHISARPEDLRSLMLSLFEAFDLLKRGRFDPVLTAASIGFGFVFIHPFEDGNGRLHRFLIQKALVDMAFNPDGVVLPVSAAILEDLLGYRAALEDYSVPTLSAIEWVATAGGNVRVTNDTAYLYRYFDATRQAEYLLDRIERTIRFALPAELEFLQRFDDAKRRLAQVIDLPDRRASLLIQLCSQNGGTLSSRKRADLFEDLKDEDLRVAEQAIAASGLAELHSRDA